MCQHVLKQQRANDLPCDATHLRCILRAACIGLKGPEDDGIVGICGMSLRLLLHTPRSKLVWIVGAQ